MAGLKTKQTHWAGRKALTPEGGGQPMWIMGGGVGIKEDGGRKKGFSTKYRDRGAPVISANQKRGTETGKNKRIKLS